MSPMLLPRSCLLVVLFFASAASFSPLTTRSSSSRRVSITSQKLVPMEHADLLNTLSENSALVEQFLHQHHHAFMETTSQFLADAAAEAAKQDDGGWWGAYLQLFKNTLNFVHSTITPPLNAIGIKQTWGPSIFLFTAMARGVLVPLSIQQSKSTEYTKALRPYMAEIKAKFKDNQDAQNRAIAKLYEDAEQNPLAGCFTSLAQLPIFLGLYRGVRLLALDGELKEPFLWIPNLEGPVSPPDFRGMDWLLQGWTSVDGLPTPPLGWETTLAFLVMPVILVLLQTVTMKTLQPAMDENATQEERDTMEKSQAILKFLPLMIGFFSLQVPAGLTIYWFTSNIFTLTQSLAVRAYFKANPPKIELPEYWDKLSEGSFENMTPEERRAATEAGIRLGPTMDQLKEEAQFHCYIERTPLRPDSKAALKMDSASIPPEMEEWVQAGSAVRFDLPKENGDANVNQPNTTTTPFYATKA